jgi:hypothetical protein
MFAIQVNIVFSLGVAESAGIVVRAVFRKRIAIAISLDAEIVPHRPLGPSSLVLMQGRPSIPLAG